MKNPHSGHALALRDEGRATQAQNRTRGRELLAGIKRNMVSITEAFFEIGEALAEIHNNAMHLALGHERFQDLLEAEGLMSPGQAAKLIAVAELVPREAAITLGQEKAFALTPYARVAEPADGVRGVLAAGEIAGKPLAELSVREIKGLVARAKTHGGHKQPEARIVATRLARQVQVALRKRGAANARALPLVTRGQPHCRVELDEEAVRALLRVL